MKKLIGFWLMAVFLTVSGFAQNLTTFSESFEDEKFPPEGWIAKGSYYYNWERSKNKNATDGDYVARSATSANCQLTTPLLQPQAGESFQFDMKACSENDELSTLVIKIKKENDTDFTELESIALLNYGSDWSTIEISLSDYVGEKVYIQFDYQYDDPDYTYASGGVFIDNVTGVSWQAITCHELVSGSLSVSNISVTSATASWENDYEAAGYNIEWVELADQTDEPDWTSAQTTTSEETSVQVSVQADKYYALRVQASCTGDMTSGKWLDYVVFATPMEYVSLPNTSVATSGWGAWFPYKVSSDSWYGDSPSIYDNYYDIYYLIGVNSNTDTALMASAAIEEDIHNVRMVFKGNSEAYYASYAQTLVIGVMSDPADMTTFEAVKEIPYDSESKKIIIDFDQTELTGSDNHIAFMVTSDDEYATVTSGWRVDEITLQTIPSCKGPVEGSLQITSIESDNITIKWEDDNEENSSWVVYVQNLSDATEQTQELSASEKEFVVDGLTAGVLYKIWVATSCGSEVSDDITNSVKAYTLSETVVADFPYTNDFEDADKNKDFSGILYDESISWTIGSALHSTIVEDGQDPDDNTSAMYVSMDGGQTNSLEDLSDNYNTLAAMTVLSVEFSDMPQYDISFDYITNSSQSYENLIRVYAVDDTIPLTYNDIWNKGTNLVKNIGADALYSTEWKHVTIPMFNVTGKKMNIVFVSLVNPYYCQKGAAIDNLHIGELVCTKPSDFKVEDLTATDIQLSWRTELMPDVYHVYYAVDSVDDNGDPMPESVVEVNDTTVRFSDENVTLLPNTAYYVYVQGDCGDDGMSIKSEVIKFVTPCDNEITSLPYSVKFADQIDRVGQTPECWTANYKNLYDRFYIYERQHNEGTYMDPVYWYDTVLYANPYYNYSYIVLPKLADTMNLSQIKVSFDSIKSNGFDIGFVSNTFDMSTFEKVTSVPASSWAPASAVFSYTGDKRFLAIRVTMGYNNAVYARSIEVGYPTDCETPVNLEATNVGSTSVDLAWQRISDNMSSFNIYYKEYLSNDDYSSSVANITTSGSNVTYTFNGLQAGTKYELYISPVCDEELTSGHIVFETECAETVTAPFAWNYELGTHNMGYDPDTLKCWTLNYIKGQTKDWSGSMYDVYVPYQSSWKGLQLELPDTILDNKTLTDISVVTPTFTNDIKDVTFRLTYSVSDSMAGRLVLGALTDPSDMSTFDSVGYIDLLKDNSNEEQVVLFADYTGNAHTLALRLSEYVPISDKNKYGISIKSMAVDSLPACPAPMKFAVVESDESSVTLTWKALKEDQTNFTVNYRAVAGLAVSDNTWQTSAATLDADGHFTVTGLAPNTVYQFVVVPECSEGNGVHTDTVAGITKQMADPADLPYEPDFSDESEASSWYLTDYALDNHWYFGSVNGLNDQYLYLSKSEGDSVYASQSSTFAVAERLLSMTDADKLDVEFDLTIYGDGQFHALTVMLVPDTVEMLSSDDIYSYPEIYRDADYSFDFIDYIDDSYKDAQYYMSTSAYSDVQRDFHIKGQMTNPNKNGNAKLLFIWQNDSYEETYPYGPRISNLSVKEYAGPQFKVVTEEATMIGDKSATLHASTEVDAQFTVAAKGFMYKSSNATDYTVADVEGDNFVYTLNGLIPETEYSFKAFISKANGNTFDTVYGEELTFTTLEEQEEIIDPTVQTASPSAVWTNAATLVANVTLGTKDITEYGFESRLATESDDNYKPTVATANGTTFTATLTGLEVNTMYTIRGYVKTEDGTFYGNVITFATSDTSSLTDVMNATLAISMYPNPTSDNATLTVNGLNSTAKVILTDVQGRVINESELPMGENTMTINTSNLESGVYYVRVTANGVLRTEKLIKK